MIATDNVLFQTVSNANSSASLHLAEHPGHLRAVPTSLGSNEVTAAADTDETRREFDAETDVARDLGIFGSPTFAVGREIFWGDDRLEDALAWCDRAAESRR